MNRQTSRAEIKTSMNQSPIALDSSRAGIREACLLLLASGFALLMMDLGNVALITGCVVVILWSYAVIQGPRPGPVLTLVYGAGLFVTCFWWPREGWWPVAIALTWIGVALMAFGALSMVFRRVRGT